MLRSLSKWVNVPYKCASSPYGLLKMIEYNFRDVRGQVVCVCGGGGGGRGGGSGNDQARNVVGQKRLGEEVDWGRNVSEPANPLPTVIGAVSCHPKTNYISLSSYNFLQLKINITQ